MSSLVQLTLAEIAVHVPGAIDIFERYDIDFYRGGKRTLKEVCEANGKDAAVLAGEIESGKISEGIDYSDWPVERLVDHIRNRYHAAEKAMLIMIGRKLEILKAQAKEDHTVVQLHTIFKELAAELAEHSAEEEKELFPYLLTLSEARKSRQKTTFRFTLLHNPIRILEVEHEHAGELLDKMRKLTGNFTIPQGASQDYMQLMNDLDAFQKDFHVHMHIENNVLFPKALELEEELREMMK